MSFFSWFKQGSNESNAWEREKNEKEYVKKHMSEIRKSKLNDLRRYNREKEDRLKL